MSLRQPQAFLRDRRGRLVSLFTPLGRLNAGECTAPSRARRDTSGFTGRQRPFLGDERALAVARLMMPEFAI